MKWILLPGFDGTGILFEPFLRALPSEITPVAVPYPADRPCCANELVDLVLAHLPKSEPFVLLGESFSGPIALRVAARSETRPLAVVLCASFAQYPVSRFYLRMLSSFGIVLTALRPPRWLVRRYLLEGAHPEIMDLFYRSMKKVSARVLAHRFGTLSEFDGNFTPPALPCPLLYLQAVGDRLITEENFALVRHRYPEAQLERVEAPHLLLQVQPEAAIRAISRFLAQHS